MKAFRSALAISVLSCAVGAMAVSQEKKGMDGRVWKVEAEGVRVELVLQPKNRLEVSAERIVRNRDLFSQNFVEDIFTAQGRIRLALTKDTESLALNAASATITGPMPSLGGHAHCTVDFSGDQTVYGRGVTVLNGNARVTITGM